MAIKRYFGQFLAAVFIAVVFVVSVLPAPAAHAAGETYAFVPVHSNEISATGGMFGNGTATFQQTGGTGGNTYTYNPCKINGNNVVTYTITGVNPAASSTGDAATISTTGEAVAAVTPGCTQYKLLAGPITIKGSGNSATFKFDAGGDIVGTGSAFSSNGNTLTLPLNGGTYSAILACQAFDTVTYTISNVQPQTGNYSTATIATTGGVGTGCPPALNGTVTVAGTSSTAPGGTGGGGTGTDATTSAPICIDGSTPDAKFKCQDGTDPICSDGSAPDAKTHLCPAVSSSDCGAGALAWIVCPVDKALQNGANVLLRFINGQLTIDTGCIFSGQGNCSGGTTGAQNSAAYYQAWNVFRVLGTALIIIAALIMVGSQALGFEFLDAYTIRKTLPRLFVAVIGMSLSWPLLQFIIEFFNTAGADLQHLMYAPFSHLPNHAQAAGGIASYSIIAAVTGLLALGFGGALLPILAAGGLALLIAVIVLIIRQVAVTILVITAPLAIAAYVLPNTKKAWDLWKDNFLGLMVMFLIVSALMAGGQIFSAVGASGSFLQQLVGLVSFYVPFFLIPLAFRMAIGLISTIFGFVNDRSKGGFDRLTAARQAKVARASHHIGNRVTAKRADWNSRLQSLSENDKNGNRRSWVRRRAVGLAAGAIGGYDIKTSASAKQAAASKEVQDISSNGDDTEGRALTARLGSDGQWRTLGGKTVNEASVMAARKRWGHDAYMQQAWLNYEMGKSSEEGEIEGLEEGYLDLAKNTWHMSDNQAAGTHIGAGFGNQAKNRWLKHTRAVGTYTNSAGNVVSEHMGLDFGDLNSKKTYGGHDAYATDMYENIGSYSAGNMNSASIKKLSEGWDESVEMKNWSNAILANTASSQTQKDLANARLRTANDRQMKIKAISETFMHDLSAGGGGYRTEEGQQVGGDQAITGGRGRTANTPGAAHTAQRVVELAARTGVFAGEPRGPTGPNRAEGLNRDPGQQRQKNFP